jgi:hypothetical protein
MRPKKRKLLKTVMSQVLLEKSARQSLEIKSLEIRKTELLVPKRRGQDLLASAVTNLPTVSPIL